MKIGFPIGYTTRKKKKKTEVKAGATSSSRVGVCERVDGAKISIIHDTESFRKKGCADDQTKRTIRRRRQHSFLQNQNRTKIIIQDPTERRATSIQLIINLIETRARKG